jgi:hypothetical protein
MPDTRQGLNATLTYTRRGVRQGFKLRCNGITYGFSLIAEESQARTRRAYYPHRLAPDRFAIRLQLKGYAEHKTLSGWLADYMSYILDPSIANAADTMMTVSVPSRNFTRKGVPVSGITYGDKVGKTLWEETVVFESLSDPADPDGYTPSKYDGTVATGIDRDVQYFYPLSTQLSGDDTPPAGAYTQVQGVDDTTPITPSAPSAEPPPGGPAGHSQGGF